VRARTAGRRAAAAGLNTPDFYLLYISLTIARDGIFMRGHARRCDDEINLSPDASAFVSGPQLFSVCTDRPCRPTCMRVSGATNGDGFMRSGAGVPTGMNFIFHWQDGVDYETTIGESAGGRVRIASLAPPLYTAFVD